MRRRLIRRLWLLWLLPVGVLLVAVLYMVGMSQLEEETQGFWQSLAVAGVPLIQARIPERTAATIIGRWVQDEFHAEVSAETVLRPGGF